MSNLDTLNAAGKADAIALIEPLIERAPDIATKVMDHRPFENAGALVVAITTELQGLAETEKLTLFRAHPELAPENPLAMTHASQTEQARLNLTLAESEYRERLATLNAAYQTKFGFPFITALVRHETMSSVFAEFETRLEQERADEIAEALKQICFVSAGRVNRAFGENSVAQARAAAGH